MTSNFWIGFEKNAENIYKRLLDTISSAPISKKLPNQQLWKLKLLKGDKGIEGKKIIKVVDSSKSKEKVK
jgi:hypothetical protein